MMYTSRSYNIYFWFNTKTNEILYSCQKLAQEPKLSPQAKKKCTIYKRIKIQYEHKRISKLHVCVTGMK